MPIRKSFSYSEVPGCSAQLRQIAGQIHQVDIGSPTGAVAAGELLERAKELLPHGSFLPWCGLEFTWNASVIRRLKKICFFFGGQNAPVERFSVSALRLLASHQVPQSVRDALLAEAIGGSSVSYTRAAQVIRLLRGESPPDSPEAVATPEHTAWSAIEGLLRSGGTLNLCVSPDADNESELVVSAWVATDQGSRGSAVRSSLAAAVAAVAGQEQQKVCTSCHRRMPLDHFSKKKKTGRASACKKCERERVKAWKRKKRSSRPSDAGLQLAGGAHVVE